MTTTGTKSLVSPESLERSLRKRLLDPRTRIKLGKIKDYGGHVEWTDNADDGINIKVDPRWVAVVGTVIHELVHVELETVLAPLGDELEELAVTAVADHIEERVYASRARRRWWEKHVASRVRRTA